MLEGSQRLIVPGGGVSHPLFKKGRCGKMGKTMATNRVVLPAADGLPPGHQDLHTRKKSGRPAAPRGRQARAALWRDAY